MRYYFLADDKIKGPFEPRELIEQPEVSEESQICTTEHFSEWMPLGSVDELRLVLEMRDSNHDLRKEKNAAESQVRELEDEYENWARQLHAKIADLNGELAQRLTQVDEACEALTAKGRESELFKTRLRELKSQYLELKQYNEVQEKDFHLLRRHLREKITERDAQIRKIQDKLDKTTHAQAERELSLQESERNCKKNTWEMSHMEDQWLEVHQQKKTLQQNNLKLEDELRGAKADVAELRRRVEANSAEVREAPARAMKAEVEAASLQETLTRREHDLQKFKEELAHQAEVTQNARAQHREALDRATFLENQLVGAESKLKTDEQEIVRLKATAAEHGNRLGEKDARAQELLAILHKSQEDVKKAHDYLDHEEAEQKRLEVHWRSQEEILRQEIRKAERDLFKYREMNENLEQRNREILRNLKKLQDKESDLQNQHEKLKKILVRKESRIEMLEAYLKEDDTEQSGRAAEPAGAVSNLESREASPEKPDVRSRAQDLRLKKMAGKIESLESVNQLMQDNLHQVQAEKRKPVEVVKPAKPTISARAAAVILWLFWLALVLGIGRILYDYWTPAPTPHAVGRRPTESKPAPSPKRPTEIQEFPVIEPPPSEEPPVEEPPIKLPGVKDPTAVTPAKVEEKTPKTEPAKAAKPRPAKKYTMPGFSSIKVE